MKRFRLVCVALIANCWITFFWLVCLSAMKQAATTCAVPTGLGLAMNRLFFSPTFEIILAVLSVSNVLLAFAAMWLASKVVE